MEKKGYVTLKQLSQNLKIKTNTLYVWAIQGKIDYYKKNNRIYVKQVKKADLLYEKVCPNCNTRFLCFRDTQKYCQKKCSGQYRSRNWARRRKMAAEAKK